MKDRIIVSVRRFLRSPRLITAELLAVAMAGVSSTLVPQGPSRMEAARFARRHPGVAALVERLGLHGVFETRWFLVLMALSACSLAVVTWDQWVRGLRELRASPSVGSFRTAPYRVEFERPARPGGPRDRIEARGRIAVLGAPLFHTGLAALLIAGVLRLLWSAEAYANLAVGEWMPTAAAEFAAQAQGWLAPPVVSSEGVRVLEIRPRWYQSGKLEALEAEVAVGTPSRERVERVGVNAPLQLKGEEVYVHQRFGIAAFVEMAGEGAPRRQMVLLERDDDGTYAAHEAFPNGIELRLRGAASGPSPAGVLELRALRGNSLLAVQKVRPGEPVDLGQGVRLVLHDLRWWAQFSLKRDVSVWPAYLGFLLMIMGALLMLVVGRVDVFVSAVPSGDGERVVVALRAGRFAPLYAERFGRIVQKEGGRWEP